MSGVIFPCFYHFIRLVHSQSLRLNLLTVHGRTVNQLSIGGFVLRQSRILRIIVDIYTLFMQYFGPTPVVRSRVGCSGYFLSIFQVFGNPVESPPFGTFVDTMTVFASLMLGIPLLCCT